MDRTVYSAPAGIPPGSYINPAFARSTTTTFDGITRTISGRQPQNVDTSAHASPSSNFTKLGGSQVGSKRKLDSFKEHVSQSASRNSKTSTPNRHPSSSVISNRPDIASAQQSKKSNANVFGLTPGTLDPHYTSSESEGDDDNLDEEAILAHGLGPNLTFHDTNGEMRTLNTAADLAAWRNARRANFPTKDRLSQKHAEKVQIGAERKRMLTEARDALRSAIDGTQSLSKAASHARSEPRAKANESKPNSITAGANGTAASNSVGAALSKRKEASEGGSAANHNSQVMLPVPASDTNTDQPQAEPVQIGEAADERRQDTGATSIDTSERSEAGIRETVTVPVLAKSAASNDVSDQDSSDDPPEETSSKQKDTAKTKSTPCRQFVASGYCRDGSTCRFKHELPDRVTLEQKRQFGTQKKDPFAPTLDVVDPDSRKTIHQRLLERDRDDQDQLALQVIKYLGSRGFFSDASTSAT